MNVQVSQVLELIKGYWDTIPQQYKLVIYLAGAVFALLNCFMGYRLRKVWGCILGVLAGAGGGGAAGYYFLQDKVMALVCAAGGALILGLLAWLLYKFGVFFMCTGLVYCMILGFFQDASMTQHILALVAGVFAGTLALGYEKQMVIGVTAICGGIGGIHLIFSMMNKGTAGTGAGYHSGNYRCFHTGCTPYAGGWKRNSSFWQILRQKRYGTSHKTKEKSSEKDKGGTEESSKREGCKG